MTISKIAISITLSLLIAFATGCFHHLQKKASVEDNLTRAINHYERGLKLEQDGKPEEAIVAYKKAIELSPRPAAYYHLGLVYAAKAEYQTAIAYFEKAIELVPTFEEAKKERDRIKDLNR